MKLGFDFDNTIVCYDRAIRLLAEEMFKLPDEIPRTKDGLRSFLRSEDREEEWTLFQGELYGPGMRYAQPFNGAVKTLQQLDNAGHELTIISHRSKWPYAGERYDLHEAAQVWVAKHLNEADLFTKCETEVLFLESKSEKIAKIAELGCSVFLDDLPEVLDNPEFPTSTTGVLFSPYCGEIPCRGDLQISKWEELIDKLKELK